MICERGAAGEHGEGLERRGPGAVGGSGGRSVGPAADIHSASLRLPCIPLVRGGAGAARWHGAAVCPRPLLRLCVRGLRPFYQLSSVDLISFFRSLPYRFLRAACASLCASIWCKPLRPNDRSNTGHGQPSPAGLLQCGFACQPLRLSAPCAKAPCHSMELRPRSWLLAVRTTAINPCCLQSACFSLLDSLDAPPRLIQ